MSFIKRAVLYCIRQRLRTAILFLTLTIIASFLLTAIAVRDAADTAAAGVRTAVGGKIVLEPDTDGNMDSGVQNSWGTVYGYTGDLITPDIVTAISGVDGVADLNAEDTAAYYGAGVDFGYIPAAFDLSYTPYGEASSYTATLSSEKCAAFQSGKYRLTDGRHIAPGDRRVCLISKELADYNGLSVGGRVKMYSLDTDAVTEFEIIGIFDGTEGTSGNALTVDEIPANRGYIDYATMFELFGDGLSGYQQLTVYADDPTDVQSVCDRISALPELAGKTLKLRIDTEEYDAVSAPLTSLQKSVNMTIVIIAAVGAAISALLLTVRVRGRKTEIGILLSVGVSRANIVLQLFAEAALTAAVSLAAAVPLSGLTAEKAGELLTPANLEVKIGAEYLPPLCIIGFLLIAAAVAVSSWTVVRANPRDILAKIS